MKLILSLTAVIAAATAHWVQDQENYAQAVELYQKAQEQQQKNLYSIQPETYSSKTTYSVEPQTLQYSLQPYVQTSSSVDTFNVQPHSYSSNDYTYNKPASDYTQSYANQPYSDYTQSYTSKPEIETAQTYSRQPEKSNSVLQSYSSKPEVSGYSQWQNGYSSESYTTQPQLSVDYSQSYTSKPQVLTGHSQYSNEAQLHTSQPQKLTDYTQEYVTKPQSVASIPQSFSSKPQTYVYSQPTKSISEVLKGKPRKSPSHSIYQHQKTSSHSQVPKSQPRPFSSSQIYSQHQQESKLPQSFNTAQQYSNHLNAFSGQSQATHLNYERPSGEKSAAVLHQNLDIDEHNYQYSYETENGIKAEEQGQTAEGTRTSGAYSYTGDDGQVYTVSYTADENGFRAQGAHLPTSPPIPEAIARSLEQNAHEEANGIFDDGKYEHQSGQDYQQVESANLHHAGVHSHAHRQPITVAEYRSNH